MTQNCYLHNAVIDLLLAKKIQKRNSKTLHIYVEYDVNELEHLPLPSNAINEAKVHYYEH